MARISFSKSSLTAVSGFIFSSLAVATQTWLTQAFEFAWWESGTIAIISTSIAFFFLDPIISHLPRSVRFLRKRFESKADTEGYWFEVINNEDNDLGRYSIIEIWYNKRDDEYYILGSNFTKQLIHVRNFTAKRFYIEETNDRIIYYYRASLEKPHIGELPGIGIVEFNKSGQNYYEEADGFFADKNPNIPAHNFKWKRITETEVFRAIGQKIPKDNKDRVRLIEWYIREFGEP